MVRLPNNYNNKAHDIFVLTKYNELLKKNCVSLTLDNFYTLKIIYRSFIDFLYNQAQITCFFINRMG